MRWVGLSKLPLAFLFVAALVVLGSAFVNAVPPEVCGPNGYYDSSIQDCRFYNEPHTPVYCDGPQSKYHSTCVNGDYYDYNSYSYQWSGYIRGQPYNGQICDASISYSDYRCQGSSGGYNYGSGSNGGSGGSYNYGGGSNGYYYDYGNGNGYNNYGGYCGNGYCEYGESAYSCPMDCYNPFGGHYYSSCNLYSYPTTVNAGSYSDIQVAYYDLFYEPGLIPVSCGNGYTAYAYNAYGTTGTAYARCYFPYAGTFYQTAYAGGIGCTPSYVSAVGGGGSGGSGGGSGGSGGQSQCSVSTNPAQIQGSSGVSAITVYYSGVNPSSASISCGDEGATVKNTGCSGGTCVAQCVYNPSQTPYYATVDANLHVNGQNVRCSSGFVSINGNGGSGGSGGSNGQSCAVILNPSSLTYNGSTNVKVIYQNFNSNVNSAEVICGNGQQFNVQCQNNKNGECNVDSCNYETPNHFPKSFPVTAVVNGQQCSSSSLLIFGNNPTPTPTPTPEYGGIVLTVKNDANAPIQAAFAVLYYQGQAVLTGHTNNAGVTSFSGLPVASYSLTVSKTGFETQTTGVDVLANQNTQVDMVLQRVTTSKSCTVSLNPSTVRPGQQSSVSIAYVGFNSPASAQVSCAGQQQQASCTGNNQGTCSTQCVFGAEQAYPQTKSVTASIDGTACNSAQATLIAPLPTQGTVVTRVTDCETGMGLQSAGVFVNGSLLYTDSNGIASAVTDPGLQTIDVSKNGYTGAQVSAFVQEGKTTSESVCLNALGGNSACNFDAQLIASPSCPYSEQPQPYQVKLTNRNATDNVSIQVSYSNDALVGLSSVLLAPSQQTIVEFNSTLRDLAGSRNAFVSFISSVCTRNIAIQACMSGGLELEAMQNTIKAVPNQKACFDLLLRNRGLASAGVVISSSSSDTSINGEFSQKEFTITAQETKPLQFCVTSPTGGLKSFTLTATSEIGTAVDSVSLDIPTSGQYSNGNGGACVRVDADDTVQNEQVSITNNGVPGDYDVELVSLDSPNEKNPLQASLVQGRIYGFEKGTSRSVYIALDPFNAKAGEHRFQLLLKKDGYVVSQQDLCFDIDSRRDQSVTLNPLSLTIQVGKSASAFLNVENTGNQRLTYAVNLPNVLPTQAYPATFRLEPGARESVEVQVTAPLGTALGTYTVPVRLVASSSESNSYAVTVYCGNGQSKTVDCKGGESTCSVTCDYPNSGVYTTSASIAGVACASADVRVSDNQSNSCFLTVNPNVMQEQNYATVTVNYRELQKGQQDNFTIQCGNGNVVTAGNCVGTSGSCSAQCYYNDAGSFTVSAASLNYSCSPAGIAITSKDRETSCRLSTQTNIVKGSSDTVTLSYDVADLPTERQELLSTQNLLVNVVSSSTRFEPVVSQNIQVTAASAVDVFPGTTTLLPVTIKNNDAFTLNTVIVYMTNLPTGVTAQQVPAFSLSPGQQVTRNIVITAVPDAPLATVTSHLRVESGSFVAPDKQVAVNVRSPTPQELLVSNGAPSFSFASQGNHTEITMQMQVTNNENQATTLFASAALPQGWSFGFAPVTLAPGETQTLTFKMATDSYEDKDFDMFLRLQSGPKAKTIPIRVPSKSSASGILGFFTAGTSGILLLLLLIGIALAAYLFYASRELEQKIEVEEEKTDTAYKRKESTTRKE